MHAVSASFDSWDRSHVRLAQAEPVASSILVPVAVRPSGRGTSRPTMAQKSSAPPCRFFQVGTCRAGADCRFSHSVDAKADVRVPCKFFAQGYCAHGERCAFSHASKTKQVCQVAQPPVTSPSQGRAGPPAAATAHGAAGPLSGQAAATPAARPAPPVRKSMVLSAAVGTAVAADSDGGKHADAASWLEPTAGELAASAATCCSVCLEPVVQQRARFGLLEGCSRGPRARRNRRSSWPTSIRVRRMRIDGTTESLRAPQSSVFRQRTRARTRPGAAAHL